MKSFEEINTRIAILHDLGDTLIAAQWDDEVAVVEEEIAILTNIKGYDETDTMNAMGVCDYLADCYPTEEDFYLTAVAVQAWVLS